jgi:Concanavalin A-like lectin/glucanases superfamily
MKLILDMLSRGRTDASEPGLNCSGRTQRRASLARALALAMICIAIAVTGVTRGTTIPSISPTSTSQGHAPTDQVGAARSAVTRIAVGAQRSHPATQTGCIGFEEGTAQDPFSGFSGVGVTLTIATPGPPGGSLQYLHTQDQAGASYVIVSPYFNGDYSDIGTCYDFSFDVRLFNDGDPSASNLWSPWVTFYSGTLYATFRVSPNLGITEDGGANPGWHHVAAPLGPLQNGQLPSSPDGTWTVSSNVTSDWTVIMANVTQIRLPVDITSSPTEEEGYDNVCLTRVCEVATYLFDDNTNIGLDWSGNGHQGVLGAATVVTAPCGYALRFNPDNNPPVNEFTIPSNNCADLNLVGPMSGMAMIRPLGQQSTDNNPSCPEGTIFTKGGNYWFQVEKHNDQLVFQNEGSGNDVARADIHLCVNNWSHVAFVRGNDGKTIRFFQNGRPIGSPTTLANLATPNNDPIMVGNHGFGNDPGACEFNGDIDEIRIFDRALSDAEVMQAYLDGCTIPPWPLSCFTDAERTNGNKPLSFESVKAPGRLPGN